ncbi:hypothetical protein LINPERHAP1_LOCUS36762 [Linum perenne]
MGRMKYQMDLRTMNLVLKWLLIRMLLKKGIIGGIMKTVSWTIMKGIPLRKRLNTKIQYSVK